MKTTTHTPEQIAKAIELANYLADEYEINTGFQEYWYFFSAKEWQKEEKQ